MPDWWGCQDSTSGSNMFQPERSVMVAPRRALLASRLLAAKVFTPSDHRAGDAEALRQLCVAGQPAARRILARDDADAERVGYLLAAGTRAPGGNPQQVPRRGPAGHGDTSLCRAARLRREASAVPAPPTAMKANKSSPVAIFAHQLDRVPSKLM